VTVHDLTTGFSSEAIGGTSGTAHLALPTILLRTG